MGVALKRAAVILLIFILPFTGAEISLRTAYAENVEVGSPQAEQSGGQAVPDDGQTEVPHTPADPLAWPNASLPLDPTPPESPSHPEKRDDGQLYYEQDNNNPEESDETEALDNADSGKSTANLKTVDEENVYVRENKISLDLKGIDILELLKIISKKMGVTIVPSKNVRGRINVFLNNLTLEDALDVIILSQDMAYLKEGNLVNIMTDSEYEKKFGRKFDEKKKIRTVKLNYAKPSNVSNVIASLKSEVGKIIVDESSGTILLIDTPEGISVMEAAIKDLDQPLETAVLDVNYARSADIRTYLNELITPGLGHAIIDERSAKAIVTDLPQRVAKIKRLIKELDETSRQVLITGQIVQVSLDDDFQQGIEWERLLSERKWHSLDFVGKFPVSSDLASFQKVNVGTLSSDDYTALIKMLQSYGKVRVLSSPQIVALDRAEAKLLVGSREAFISQTTSQAQTSTEIAENVQFVDVGVKLNVVPIIGKDGFITIKIKPEVSSVRETIVTSRGSQIPIIETSEAESIVKVKDGSMIMIAGLMKDENRDIISGWPLISKAPFLGRLFSNRTTERKKSELIIFLTPKLMSGEFNTGNETGSAGKGKNVL